MNFFFPSYRIKRFDFLKSNESWSSVIFIDPIVIPLVLFLKRSKDRFPFYIITPNVLTLFSFLIFFLTVALMLFYPNKHMLLGCGLIISTAILDLLDGQLARATGAASNLGAIIDSLSDLFRTSLGLALVGLALARAHNVYWLFILMTIYSLFHGAFHMNHITEIISGSKNTKSLKNKKSCEKTPWQIFCDQRGFVYSPFSEYEASLLIFLSIIFFHNPAWIIAGVIITRIVYWPIVSALSPKYTAERLR